MRNVGLNFQGTIHQFLDQSRLLHPNGMKHELTKPAIKAIYANRFQQRNPFFSDQYYAVILRLCITIVFHCKHKEHFAFFAQQKYYYRLFSALRGSSGAPCVRSHYKMAIAL